MQRTCGFECEVALGTQIAAKNALRRKTAENAEHRAKLAASRRKLPSEKLLTQKVINEYVRARDYGQPCISCGTAMNWTDGLVDAGHFRSVSSAPHLRYDLRNIHAQCKHCNSPKGLSGNYHEYAKRLPAKLGRERFDKLMADYDARHYSADQLARMRKIFAKKIRIIKARRDI